MSDSGAREVAALAARRLRGGGERLARWAEVCEPRVGETREARAARLDAAHLAIFGVPREKQERRVAQQQQLGFGLDDENDPVPF